jgi:hypothetical protein
VTVKLQQLILLTFPVVSSTLIVKEVL